MKVLMVLLIIFSLVSCQGQYTKWEKNVTRNQIEFSKLRYFLANNDTVSVIGFLNENAEINQFACQKNWVHFTPEWELTLFCLNENTSIANRVVEKDSWVYMKPENDYIGVVLPENKVIDGYVCLGGVGPKGTQTSFYKSGELRSFFTKNEVEISGVKCKGGVLAPIVLHKNGKLKACKSAESFTINGVEIKKGTKITFDEKGVYQKNER